MNRNDSFEQFSSQPQHESSSFGTLLREFVQFALIAALIVIPIRMFIAQPFVVSGSSMDPTFATGQYLIVDELSYQFRDPVRGEVVILRYPVNPSKFFIKRVIGLPEETVTIQSGNVTITTAEGKTIELTEPYIEFERETDYLTRTLEEDEYFVMGDNRAGSSDSRIWGPVPRDNMVGRAFVRLLPVASASILPGEY